MFFGRCELCLWSEICLISLKTIQDWQSINREYSRSVLREPMMVRVLGAILNGGFSENVRRSGLSSHCVDRSGPNQNK